MICAFSPGLNAVRSSKAKRHLQSRLKELGEAMSDDEDEDDEDVEGDDEEEDKDVD